VPRTILGDELEAAVGLLEEARFSEASEQCLGILDEGPVGDTLYTCLMIVGITAMTQDRFEESLKYFSQAADQFPEKNGSKHCLGVLHFRHDRYAEAKRLLQEADYSQAKELLDLIGLMGNRSPFVIDFEDTTTEVSLSPYRRMPIVSVQGDGTRADFLIDTGSEYVVVDPAALAATSKDALQGLNPSIPKSSWMVIDTLALQGLTVKNVPARVLNLSSVRSWTGQPIYGILGAAFFYHFVNEFDFLNGKITLKPKERMFGIKGGEQLMLAADYVPFSMATLNEYPGALIIDTGVSDYGVVIQEDVAKEVGVYAGYPSAVLQMNTVNYVSECSLAGVTIGGMSFPNPKGAIGNLNIPDYGFRLLGLLGYSCMQDAIVTMDYANMRFHIQKGGLP
jgi:predicted aspartyl protease